MTSTLQSAHTRKREEAMSGQSRRAALVALGAMTAAAALAAFPGSISTASTSSIPPAGTIKHVVWIVDENHSYDKIIGVPKDAYLNSLATTYGSASNDWAITHPSVPNYLGLTSGLPLVSLPIADCTKCTQPGPDVFTQGESWRAYEESMPTPCDRIATSDGLYVPKHNPPLYYRDVPSAACNTDDLPYTALATDLKNHTLPAFSFIAPNMNDNMHNTGNLAGQSWLQAQLPALLNSTEFTSGSMVIFLMWDEGSPTGEIWGTDCTTSTSDSCHVPLLVLSHWTHGVNYGVKLTHYSVLKATEDLLGVPELGQAKTAASLTAAFGL
jgi:phosphatidylinositol-3-phosphatase